VQEAMNEYILHLFLKEVKKSIPPWWSSSLSKAIKAKQSFYKRYIRSKTHADHVRYVSHRNLVKSKAQSAQISYEKSLIKNVQSNRKAFVKSKQKVTMK